MSDEPSDEELENAEDDQDYVDDLAAEGGFFARWAETLIIAAALAIIALVMLGVIRN
ncbi:MAG: hypothetical protein JRN58_09880 [Nitrososphaerota archaeon]|nr:hypothetical protein [Nitrososphaerota archaeon]MDG6979375.1 hypothetical protein [Nitrososphaerota archaeon]